MKNQYFGDVNDFVKYGLLRALAAEGGVRIGVCWMLTPDDGRADGNRRGYLEKQAWRRLDPELHDRLKRIAHSPSGRQVRHFSRLELVPWSLDFAEIVPDDRDRREAWLARALETLAGQELLFFDPDNGFEVKSRPMGRKFSSKYLFWSEARSAWKRGCSLLVYQHFGRQKRGPFVRELCRRTEHELAGARVEPVRTAHAVFILASQGRHLEGLNRGLESARARWDGPLRVGLEAAMIPPSPPV